MKKLIFKIFLLVVAFNFHAQQLPQYTQFLFNKVGYSPAASGTSLNYPFEIIFGARTQWVGINNNPKVAFLNANYTFIPQRAYKNWHNVGVYIDQDKHGVFIDNSMYLSYAFHQFIAKRTVMSVGVFAGMKQFKLNTSLLNTADPAVSGSAKSFLAYPDIIPGIRIYNKKFFVDLSLWQLSIFSQRNYFNGKQIGSPSKLPAHYILSFGRKFMLPLENKFLVSVNLRSSYKTLPNFEINFMNYWYTRFAYGFSLRGKNFVCGIFQVRIINNLIVGFAYDLSINRYFRGATHTGEIMIGLSPVFGNSMEKKSIRIVDDCYF